MLLKGKKYVKVKRTKKDPDDCTKCVFNPDNPHKFDARDGFYVCDEVNKFLGKCNNTYFKEATSE